MAAPSRARRSCPTCSGPINLGPGQHAYCSEACRPECSVEGCSRPTRGTTIYCEGHRHPTKYRWAIERGDCVVCGNPVTTDVRRRAFCSDACKKLGRDRPKAFACARCGDEVSLIELSPRGSRSRKTNRRLRSDAALCHECRNRPMWSALSVPQLIKRDGIECKLCGYPVHLKGKGDLRPSIDHILPRAAGGSDDADNLQLAHLWCNRFKGRNPDRKPSGSLLKNIAAEVNSIGHA